MPVKASRIKWKLAPSFDPRPYLTDPIIQQAFEDPEVLRRPKTDWPRVAKAKVHASKSEVLALAEKWDQLGACNLVSCERVDPVETVGLFAVPKDSEFDRLILNPSVVNSRSFSYSNYTKTLAPGYLVSMITPADDEQLVISSDDLCEFYCTFGVSSKRAQRNAIGIRYSASEVAHLQCYDPSVHSGSLYLCLGTLAMGDALAVEIAQQSHLNLLRLRAGCMLPEECLQYRRPIPRGPFYELLTIDDHIGLQKIKTSGDWSLHCNRDEQVFEAANQAYVDVGLTAHPGKRQRREPHAVVLGAEIDGCRGRVSAPRARVMLLSFITSIVVHKGFASKQLLQGLLGCWTHILLFRRPVFAVLDAVYTEGDGLKQDELFKLSRATKNELMALCLLAPAIQTNMRTQARPQLFLMDASPYGTGICRTTLSAAATDELWRHSEQRGYYTRLQEGPGLG